MKYIIGLDIGTSSTKSILLTTKGNIVAQGKASYSLSTPHPEWAEANSQNWFDAVIKLIKDFTSKVDSNNIVAIGIDGLYSGSGIPIAKNGNILGPTLIWMDRRANQEAYDATKLVSKSELVKVTGNISDPYYGFTKLMWIKRNKPALYRKAYKFVPPESYIIYKLTGSLSINYSAGGNFGGIFNINKDCWSKTLTDKLGININKLPSKFIDSTSPAGHITEKWANRLGLKAGTPMFNTGVDVGPATVGTGVFTSGTITSAIGTSMNTALVTRKPLINHRLIIWPYPYKPLTQYYNFAGANTAGVIVAWFIQQFGTDLVKKNGPVQLDKMSKDVPAGSNGLLVLPFFMGERSPIWDSNVRGTILGVSLDTTKYDIYNAFQEAIAYSVRQSVEQFGPKVGNSITLVGGVSHSKKMVHMIADVTGKTILTTKSGGEANLGSAILAGIGMHLINPRDASQWIKIDEKVKPNLQNHKIYNKYFNMYKKAYMALKDFYKKFTRI